MSNIKGNLPIIKQILYKIPVLVYDKSINKFKKDSARRTKKNDQWVYEFARRGNILPLFNRPRGKMMIFSPDGVHYQPMELNLDTGKIYLPDFDAETWHLNQIKRVENKYKKDKDARAEAFKYIGIGIAGIMILIGLGYLLGNMPITNYGCDCTIQGIDLVKCQQLLTNQTITPPNGGFI